MEDDAAMCEVGVAAHGSDSEDNPNQADEGIGRQEVNEDHVGTEVSGVLVSTSDGLISAEQLRQQFPATHIVIQDVHSVEIGNYDASKAEKTPVTPFTPSSPNSSNKFRWLETSLSDDAVLPVRCKNTNGELHKARFGSGGKGKCIYSKDVGEWFTPSEFESFAGRANSKDWKRSIRYGGRTLNYLIREGIIQPHATACTCSSCCDDDEAVGPVRLFTPYKRRKKDDGAHPARRNSRMDSNSSVVSKDNESSDPNIAKQLMVNANEDETISTPCEENVEVMMEDSVVSTETIVLDPQHITHNKNTNQIVTTKSFQSFTSDIDEHKMWWQLEEALNAARIETEMSLSRALMEARSEKEIAIQQALHQARVEMNEKFGSTCGRNSQKCINCNRDAVSKFSNIPNQPYCSLFCQKRDSLINKTENNRLFTSSATLVEHGSTNEDIDKDKNC
ncbi:Deformed epidermal autoregulatory factor 1 [Nymphon striatum]|nr:Deformed epidermal autoregulatory factor 1 [Nymphon striatum]